MAVPMCKKSRRNGSVKNANLAAYALLYSSGRYFLMLGNGSLYWGIVILFPREGRGGAPGERGVGCTGQWVCPGNSGPWPARQPGALGGVGFAAGALKTGRTTSSRILVHSCLSALLPDANDLPLHSGWRS